MNKVYIITTAHPYNDVRVTHRIARSFIENGFDVSWFGPAPTNDYRPLYGIKFNFFGANTNFCSRAFASRKLKRLLKSFEPADIYFAVDPDSIDIANYYCNRFGKKSVFDIHEIYHKDMLAFYLPKYLIPVFGFFLKLKISQSCSRANLVIGVGETRVAPYIKSAKQIMIIRHCVPTAYVKGIMAAPFENAGSIRIMQGKISQEQGTLKLLLAAKRASILTNVKVKVVLFKIYSAKLTKQKFNEFVLNNDLNEYFEIYDAVAFEQMFPILKTCDLGVISYQRLMGKECMPNRIFEFMSVGLPALVPTYAIEMQKILANYGCGISADMENENDISNALIYLITNVEKAKQMGINGRKYFVEECNWEKESKKLIDWMKD